MGAKLFKETDENKNALSLPGEVDFFLKSHKKLHSEFNKLYLISRNELHALTKDPSKEMLKNISKYLRKNSKVLKIWFQEAEQNQYDIVNMVTERLTQHDSDYQIPSTDSKHIDKFLRSSANCIGGKQRD